jgi:hypothetical protein
MRKSQTKLTVDVEWNLSPHLSGETNYRIRWMRGIETDMESPSYEI